MGQIKEVLLEVWSWLLEGNNASALAVVLTVAGFAIAGVKWLLGRKVASFSKSQKPPHKLEPIPSHHAVIPASDAALERLLEGRQYFLQGRMDAARQDLDRALQLYRDAKDKNGEANTLRSLGDLERQLGRMEEARKGFDAALLLYRVVQNRQGEANTLFSLGDLEYQLGRMEEARKGYDAALPLYRAVQDRLGEANTLRSLGELEYRLGRTEEARKGYDAALLLYRVVQNRLGEAIVLFHMGEMTENTDPIRAINSFEDAAILFNLISMTDREKQARDRARVLCAR